MNCPLCNHDRAGESWLGSTYYLGREYRYVRCLSCGSLYCASMPDEDTLGRMYGTEYETSFGHDRSVGDPKEPQRVTEWLARLGGGTFVDYGCGAGALLEEARRLGWQAVGVEFDAEVARAVRGRTGAMVVTSHEELPDELRADVLHLGDVIKHLTDLDRQLPSIVRLIKPGGLLLAQGPLEANGNLFTLVLRLARRLHRRRTEMPPYHVLLATAAGQRRLFGRMGLDELDFTVREVAWPAPSRLLLHDLRRPRAVGLFVLRRLSQAVSTLAPSRWGNRYFYAGRRAGSGSTRPRAAAAQGNRASCPISAHHATCDRRSAPW